jgi:hypothetical protein
MIRSQSKGCRSHLAIANPGDAVADCQQLSRIADFPALFLKDRTSALSEPGVQVIALSSQEIKLSTSTAP